MNQAQSRCPDTDRIPANATLDSFRSVHDDETPNPIKLRIRTEDQNVTRFSLPSSCALRSGSRSWP